MLPLLFGLTYLTCLLQTSSSLGPDNKCPSFPLLQFSVCCLVPCNCPNISVPFLSAPMAESTLVPSTTSTIGTVLYSGSNISTIVPVSEIIVRSYRLLFPVFCRFQFVYSWPEVGRISSKSNVQMLTKRQLPKERKLVQGNKDVVNKKLT